MHPRSPGPIPDWRDGGRRILYLRYDRIGDMVLATGIIRAIATARPGVAIDVLASPGNAKVLEGNPFVARVLTFDRKRTWGAGGLVRTLRDTRYDAVIDAMVMAPSLTTMLLMWASGARHRIGVAERGNEFAFTLTVPAVRGARHYIDHSAAILRPFGVDPERERPAGEERACGGWGVWMPELYLSDEEKTRGEVVWDGARGESGESERCLRLVVNVSAGAGWRYWPAERFVAVIDAARRVDARIAPLVIGEPRDEGRMRDVAAAAGARVAMTPSYRDMMALVAASDMVLTVDTSVTHIASAFRRPTVALFGRTRSALYGPYGTAPCRVVDTPSLTIDGIGVAPVVNAVSSLMEQIRGAGTINPAV
jgi:ADP-heptose:LPS heptosyltransferase